MNETTSEIVTLREIDNLICQAMGKPRKPKQPKSYRVDVYETVSEAWIEVFTFVRLDAAIKCEAKNVGQTRIVRVRDGKVRTAEGSWK